jgi:hypothetical protein
MTRSGRRLGGLLIVVLGAAASQARAQAPSGAPRENPFACLGEGESIVRAGGTDQLLAEVARRVAHPPAADDPPAEAARHHCVTAELMRRIGDPRTAEYYQKAIATAPDEPGYELLYGYYLRNVRGPRHPLDEQAETHYFRALEKLDQVQRGGRSLDFDQATDSWAQRGLISLYQEDGLPVLSARAYRFPRNGASSMGLGFTSMFQFSRDTGSFGEVDDVRRFTSEAAFASSTERLNRPLDTEELKGIVRTPMRIGFYNRLRLRVPTIGAFDAGFNVFRAPRSQISYFTEPNNFGDVKVNEASVGYRRAFDLYPVFDLLLDVSYHRVERTGVVEWFPDLREVVHMVEARPAISRFFGPDKATVGMNYVFMDIPEAPGGPVYDRVRQRAIRAFWFDYSVYRPLLLPNLATRQLERTLTRGLSFYGGYALDDEVYGVRTAQRRDLFAGTALRGIGGFDFTLQGTYFRSDNRYASRGPDGSATQLVDSAQSNAQVRPTFVLLYRLVDEETIPDVPRSPLAGLNLVVPIRHDFALRGADTFESTRAGAELWSKLIVTGMRGTTFLLTAGYEAQWFHHLHLLENAVRVQLRMGWGNL